MSSVLYLKGSNLPGQGKKRLGECIKSQRVLMIVKLKNLEGVFHIRFIDEKTKQSDVEFRKLDATMTPVLVHQGIEYQDVDEIAYHLEKHFPDPPLETHDVEANALGGQATPMSSLAGWIKNKDPKREDFLRQKFEKSMGDIDHSLGKREGPFICGEELKFPDCILLPKLYHAKVAALYIKNYDFTKPDPRVQTSSETPPVFKNIGNYLKAAMGNPVFSETCPSENEIQEKWRNYKR
ncbi:glutathione S-transferase DHAR1, mitochondrial-like [Actinia tenebrosa]|uniref:Glutathione S-transferase DHAR1, mitochondrial-like n=1 Tax=Actinia tenebrosa TaxID=6105 RepID=A0A6P8HYC5_ACTTE|nr:glutathione S-transferase DHAR1, mitochondrial-like [Actinia tenebrosa]